VTPLLIQDGPGEAQLGETARGRGPESHAAQKGKDGPGFGPRWRTRTAKPRIKLRSRSGRPTVNCLGEGHHQSPSHPNQSTPASTSVRSRQEWLTVNAGMSSSQRSSTIRHRDPTKQVRRGSSLRNTTRLRETSVDRARSVAAVVTASPLWPVGPRRPLQRKTTRCVRPPARLRFEPRTVQWTDVPRDLPSNREPRTSSEWGVLADKREPLSPACAPAE